MINNDPLVSVCIPAYNNAAYIGETISCILNQTYQNIELVICDDKSTDDTVAVVKKFHDPRIKLFLNENNLGMAGNWNNCLNRCRGEYIKLICADDMLETNALEKEVRALIDNPSAVMSESDTQFRDLCGNTKGEYHRYKKSGLIEGKQVARACLFSKNWFGAPLNNTFRRSVLKSVKGFDPSFKYILDYDFFIRIACLGKIYIIHEPLNYFRLRNDSNTGKVLSSEGQAYLSEHKLLLKKHRDNLHISWLDFELSVLARKILSIGSGIYLKLFLK
ncbi:glycosyltransferase family 2 protein [Lactimicrobium massiliense]|uniref:glycosyltransferase family 2 protein n=1 Tax=Lactimicrobium massiliense TaxID=2161814 RepID=UPI000D56228B|nr:glycosyltransferase [Lactimicrobium massiliense]